jgi:anti-sigma factor RsiW
VKDLVCATGVDLIIDYLEGELAPELVAAVDQHVAACPRCAAFLASYRATPTILRRVTAAALPAELSRALLAAVRAAGPRSEDR